jgi:dolichol kinase
MARPSATLIRPLTPGQTQRLDALRKFSQLLDTAFVVPGTSFRIGLDPILGLIPGIGDLVSPLFTLGILWQGRDLHIPRVVQMRMIFNVAIDAFVGAVPLAGDLFDFVWKANIRNLALLERHAAEQRPASAGDWVFVAIMMLIVIALAAIPFLIAGWLIAAIGRWLF